MFCFSNSAGARPGRRSIHRASSNFDLSTPTRFLLLNNTIGRWRDTEPCDLSTEALQTFQIKADKGIECVGNISSITPDGFTLNLMDCPPELTPAKSFTCLGSTSFDFRGTKAVVTMETGNYSSYTVCSSVASNGSSFVFYLLDANHCHLERQT